MQSLAMICIFVAVPLVLASIYRSRLSHQRFMKVLQLKADVNSKLLDRFSQDPAVLDFFKSEAQQHLFDVKLPEPEPVVPVRLPQFSSAFRNTLTMVQIAFMLLSGGIALLWLSVSSRSYDSQEGFGFLGAMGIALGVGALLSAVAGYFVAQLERHHQDQVRS